MDNDCDRDLRDLPIATIKRLRLTLKSLLFQLGFQHGEFIVNVVVRI